MSTLFENPLPLMVIGGLATTAALVFFLARRTGGALGALVGALALTAFLLLVERLVVTDREEVEQAVASLFSAIESNDAAGVLAWADPNSNVSADVQALMPLIRVEKARTMGSLNVELQLGPSAPTALSSSRVYLDGVHASSGLRVVYANQRVELNWAKPADRWLVTGYTAYYDGRPIDAVNSARANQPR